MPSAEHFITAAPRGSAGAREPGPAGREAGRREAEGAPPIRRAIDDRWLVALLVPVFGLGIPHLLGLYGAIGPADPRWWAGHAWFLAGAAGIYGANRALLLAGRAHADWFSRPLAKLVILGVGVVFGTVPSTVVMMHGWAAISGDPVGGSLREVLLINVVCVVFVTWLYETLFLIGERVDDQVRLERIATARAEAELAALRAQVDPHFLFNALNTLAGLIEARPPDARVFVDHLARVYRALLDSRGRATVPLREELELAQAYVELLRVRFGASLVVTLPREIGEGYTIPPLAVQTLLENAVRHNALDPADPLVVAVTVKGAALTVAHRVHPRPPRPGAGLGLPNLAARVLGATGRELRVERGEGFRVDVPLGGGP